MTMRERERERASRLNSKKPSTDFLEEFEIPKIPDHLYHITNLKDEVIILSLNDEERYIMLDGLHAQIWNQIDGKRTWGIIFNTHTISHDAALHIANSISTIITRKDFSNTSTSIPNKTKLHSGAGNGDKKPANRFGGRRVRSYHFPQQNLTAHATDGHRSGQDNDHKSVKSDTWHDYGYSWTTWVHSDGPYNKTIGSTHEVPGVRLIKNRQATHRRPFLLQLLIHLLKRPRELSPSRDMSRWRHEWEWKDFLLIPL